MICCSECFADEWLRTFITRKSQRVHKCDFCGTDDVAAVEVERLTPFFDNLLGQYEMSEDGYPLDEQIEDDWGVFNRDRLDSAKRAVLLSAILASSTSPVIAEGGVARGLYCHKMAEALSWTETDVPDPDDSIAFSRTAAELGEILRPSGRTLKRGTVFYRARLGYQKASWRGRFAWEGETIGAPSAQDARWGRFNRKGEPMLYCATDESTAIAELRPARGLCLSVCSLTVARDVVVADLVGRVRRPNPFTSSTPLKGYIAWRTCELFADKVTRPVERNHVDECRQSQNFASAVRRCGFSGIQYRSALAPAGSNLVLFNPADASIGASHLVRVTAVTTMYERVNQATSVDPLMVPAEEGRAELTRNREVPNTGCTRRPRES